MDVETLYDMAKAVTISAENGCKFTSDIPCDQFTQYGAYRVYLGQYNKIASLSHELFGNEAKQLFPLVKMDSIEGIGDVIPIQMKNYCEFAISNLNAVTSYIHSKLGTKDKQIEGIIDLIHSKLRPAIFKPPEDERKDVQNALEIIFNARDLNYRREKVHIPYSSKTYIPDFTFDTLDLAVESKLCKVSGKEKSIIDEINADIPAYKTKYQNLLFVVYDAGGFIRDVDLFKSDIEGNTNVKVIVIKH